MTRHPQSSTFDEVAAHAAEPDLGPFSSELTCTIHINGDVTLDTRKFGGAWQDAADIERRLVDHGLCVRVVDAYLLTVARQILTLCRDWEGRPPECRRRS
jgi:hypothetical protein